MEGFATDYPGGQAWREQNADGRRPPGDNDCVVCGSTPARRGTVRIVTGLILWLRWETVKGPFCRDCGTAVVRQHTNRTMLTGWWGVFAFPFNLYTIGANLFAGRRFGAQTAPTPQPDVVAMGEAPLDPGAPLLRRPGPYVGVAVVLAVAAWLGADLLSQADRDASGAIVGAGEVLGGELKVGDCFDLPEGEFTGVNAVPCSDPHELELVAVVSHPGGGDAPYPSNEEFTQAAAPTCVNAFENYVGTPLDQSEIGMTTITPTPDGWKGGDRQIQCVVGLPDVKLDESVRDSGR